MIWWVLCNTSRYRDIRVNEPFSVTSELLICCSVSLVARSCQKFATSCLAWCGYFWSSHCLSQLDMPLRGCSICTISPTSNLPSHSSNTFHRYEAVCSLLHSIIVVCLISVNMTCKKAWSNLNETWVFIGTMI